MDQVEQSEEKRNIRIVAVMTAGRWGPVRSLMQINSALNEIGIPLVHTQGVFWGQCLSRAMEETIDKVDYFLTIDWDSMITADQIRQLVFDTISKNLDAVVCLQVRRGGKLPLISLGVDGSAEFPRGAIIPISTGHFGLSLFRADMFHKLKKPWFLAVPSDEGRWNTESSKIDEDIYFWHNLRDSGFQAWCHTGIKIGHLEEMVTCYDGNLDVEYLYPQEWLDQQAKEKNDKLQEAVRPTNEQELQAIQGEAVHPDSSDVSPGQCS